MKVVGIDLAGKPENETGFCFLQESEVETKVLHTDEEIIKGIERIQPDLIAIDAPFDFPEDGMYRDSDLELKDRGFKPLSPNFPGMKILVRRVKGLLKKIEELDFNPEVIEVFPQATGEILQLTPSADVSEDEFDALLCAISGKKYLKNEYEDLNGIVVPEV